ncbi:alcohol dehydrogenase catalytic domain-containing protein [Candidatus Bathyarchaeota archaeon]|nr:alcohol dehydrogenase catalytic domain-containing protein [Candidatus Bathyarchaeota archaeon]
MVKTMMANVYYGPRDLRFEKTPIPEVRSGDILVKVVRSSVCASDVRVFKGEKKAKPGTVLGHEFVGEISEIGEGVEGFSVGDMVTVYPVVFCGSCFYCQTGHQNMCANRKTFGYDYNGAFAEYVLVPSKLVRLGNVVRVPEKIPPEEAALTEPLGCSINGVEVLNLKVGESLLIIGAGPMGLMLLLVAKRSGVGKLIVSEVDEDRLKLAKRLGADVVVNPREESLIERVMSETEGLGVDAAILSVGVPGVVEEALKALRKKGRLNLFAGFPLNSKASLDLNLIHYKMLHVTASQNAPLTVFKRALKMIADGRINLRPLITGEFPLSGVKHAIERRIRLEGLKPIIINPSIEEG